MPTSSIVFSPSVNERQLDREVSQVNDAFAETGRIDVQADGPGLGTPEAGTGIGAGVSGFGGTLLSLAERRNDLLAHLSESLDKDFIGSNRGSSGSGGGGGGGGGGPVQTVINIAGASKLVSLLKSGGAGLAAGIGGGLLSSLASTIGPPLVGLISGASLVGLIQAKTDFFAQIQRAGDRISQFFGGDLTETLLGGANLLDRLTGGNASGAISLGAGLVEGFRGEGLFNVEAAIKGAQQVNNILSGSEQQLFGDSISRLQALTWPDTPGWIDSFDTMLTWPATPGWFESFDTMLTWPEPPQWVQQAFGVSDPTGPTSDGGDSPGPGGARPNDSTGGRNADGERYQITNNNEFQLDTQQLEQTVDRKMRELERKMDDFINSLDPDSPGNTRPGGRY